MSPRTTIPDSAHLGRSNDNRAPQFFWPGKNNLEKKELNNNLSVK